MVDGYGGKNYKPDEIRDLCYSLQGDLEETTRMEQMQTGADVKCTIESDPELGAGDLEILASDLPGEDRQFMISVEDEALTVTTDELEDVHIRDQGSVLGIGVDGDMSFTLSI